MGDELLFQKNLVASLFKKYLSYEHNFSQIHLKDIIFKKSWIFHNFLAEGDIYVSKIG